MTISRRRFIHGAAAAAVLTAGCLADGGDDGDGGSDGSDEASGGGDGDDGGSGGSGDGGGDRDSVPVLTGHEVSEHAVRPASEQYSNMEAWGLFLASNAAAEEHFGDVEGSGAASVRAFVDATDFESGDRLLYLQAYGRQTCYALEIEGEPSVAENGLPRVEAGVARTAAPDEPCGDAITAVRALLRLSFDPEAGSPDAVEVEIAGHVGGTAELLLEAET